MSRPGCLLAGLPTWRLVKAERRARGVLQAKKFDKKYDDAFDDFRTSGNMPDIPSIGEQYANAASYARSTGADVTADGETFGKRLTEEQEALQRQQAESLQEYEEIKKEYSLGLCTMKLADAPRGQGICTEPEQKIDTSSLYSSSHHGHMPS